MSALIQTALPLFFRDIHKTSRDSIVDELGNSGAGARPQAAPKLLVTVFGREVLG
ncbi:MAG: hypothetical protein ACFFDI_19615 [Promethearchaeota archaeon]